MKTRIIHTKIWKDSYFVTLNRTEKLLFIYLIANEKVNICGVYEITDREISFDLDIPKSQVQIVKRKFQEDKKIYFHNNWVAILNLHKYQCYSGPKNLIASNKEIELIPKEFRQILKNIPYQYPIDSISADDNTLINQKPETSNNNLETKNEEQVTPVSSSLAVERMRKKFAQKKTLGEAPMD